MYQVEIAPGITFVEGARRGRFPYGNILVLTGTGARVVVDTGAGEDVLTAVKAGGQVDIVINTHYHIDHVRGNHLFPGAEFWCPTVEAGAMASADEFIRVSGWDLEGSEGAMAIRKGFGWRPTRVARGLADGEVLDLGGLQATVLHLPGHTPGHIGLWFEKERVIFSADIDLSAFGPWYGDVFSNVDDYVDSIRRLAYIVGGTLHFKETGCSEDGQWLSWAERTCLEPGARPTSILTSHQRPMTYESFAERLPAFKAHFAEREERILAVLAQEGPLTLEDLTLKWTIYGPQREVLPGIYKSEHFMVSHHLTRLARAKKIEVVPSSEAGSTGEVAGGVAGAGPAGAGGKRLWRVR
jgi:glyoxylase-like metal-dependent hydrolase (beta-lactamase superfamily II)